MEHGDIFISSGVGDQFCGNFVMTTPEETVLWEAEPHFITSGTVSIYYDEGKCESLIVRIEQTYREEVCFSVPLKNTRSFTIRNLRKVCVHCTDGSGTYRGKYCLSIHYRLDHLDDCEEE
ncbi:S-Ena type endospore appendage [Rubeoparvulum massiliense]|uniref:S-Ena type endospore appendage n=1 Tax=Rubeoparvulum massiliense TaxID=1631346 RepID=UPI00065DD077|nr:S-Ena type endospore appendage [Rubeoparvulum massiliense]